MDGGEGVFCYVPKQKAPPNQFDSADRHRMMTERQANIAKHSLRILPLRGT